MKRITALLLALLMLAVPCAMAENEEEIPERTVADTFEFEVSEEGTFVENLIFDKDITVTGEKGRVMFANCVFNAGIVNECGEGAKVIILPGCEFGKDAKCVINSSLEDATLETDLPKFMLLCDEVPALECENAGAFVAFADKEMNVNGVKYTIDDALFFLNDATGDFGEYTKQEADMQNIAMWTENGEAVFMHVAIKTSEEE